MKNIMAAASEAEIGALFHNGQEGAYMRTILKELGRKKPDPPESPQTTPQPMDWPTNAPRSRDPKQWTCDSTGSRTESNKASSKSIGYKES
jgi:hypothetical protein